MLIAYSEAFKRWGISRGFIIFIIGENQRYASLVWSSKKIRCVIKSTITAETLALWDAAEYYFLIRSMIQELLNMNNFVQDVPTLEKF